MAGMFLAGNAVFTSFAVGTMLVVAVAMLGSVTVLPAVLSKLGDNVEKGRVPYPRPPAPSQSRRVARVGLGHRQGARPPGRLRHRRRRHPGRPRAPRAEHEDGQPRRRRPAARPADHADLRAHPVRVPGRPAPRARRRPGQGRHEPRGPEGHRRAQGHRRPARRASSPARTSRSRSSRSRSRATAPTRSSDAALVKLRDTTIPATIGKVAGTETNVTGMTAGSKDFNDKMNSRLPIVFAFVLGLAFLLLLVTFRSIVVPLKAIVLNLLSRRRGLRHPHVHLPGRPLREPAQLPLRRRHHVLAAAVPVRDPVRAEHGLPRVHHQPHPRGGRRRDEHRQGRRARHQGHGGRRDQRRGRDGRGVRDLRQPVA